MNSHLANRRSLSNQKIHAHIRREDNWWSDLLDDDLKQHFSRLKLHKTSDSILTSSINSTNRFDAPKYLGETLNEKIKQKNNDINFKSELDKLVENLELNKTLSQLSPYQLAQMSAEQMKQHNGTYFKKNDGKKI